MISGHASWCGVACKGDGNGCGDCTCLTPGERQLWCAVVVEPASYLCGEALPCPDHPVVTRPERARTEIAWRRELAQGVEHFTSPWGWVHADRGVGLVGYQCTDPDAGLVCETPDYGTYLLPGFIASNDPAHVLAVLAAADATLDRHSLREPPSPTARWVVDMCRTCRAPWPCPDATAVLDLYAPQHPNEGA